MRKPEQRRADTNQTQGIERTQETQPGRKLYDVQETTEGQFEVLLPVGHINLNRGTYAAGAKTETFPTREAASESVTQTKEERRILSEHTALAQWFSGSYFRIARTDEGTFAVTLPGFVSKERRALISTSTTVFETWDAAKAYFLKETKQHERLSGRPILELQTADKATVAFSDWASFNPKVVPTDEIYQVPASIQETLLSEKALSPIAANSASTYEKTRKTPDWEEKLFLFVEGYLRQQEPQWLNELAIEDLSRLSPRQAIDLSTRLVLRLTKYRHKKEAMTLDTAGQETREDRMDALSLLQEGLHMKSKTDWEGNGVCRNFASVTKAIFDALKAKQVPLNKLKNTYCLFETGKPGEAYQPRWKSDEERMNDTLRKKTVDEYVGHAWNSFVTVTHDGKADSVVVDTTWGARDFGTGEVAGLDHTLLRMEPVVHRLAQAHGETGDKEAQAVQVQQVLAYYALQTEWPGRGVDAIPPAPTDHEKQRASYLVEGTSLVERWVQAGTYRFDIPPQQLTEEDFIDLGRQLQTNLRAEVKKIEQAAERQFFVRRSWEIIKQQRPETIPATLKTQLVDEFCETGSFEVQDLETLVTYLTGPTEQIQQERLLTQLVEKHLSHRRLPYFIVRDDQLQRKLIEAILKKKDRPVDFDREGEFRARVRTVLPALIPEWTGETDADKRELIGLIEYSPTLRKHLPSDTRGMSSSSLTPPKLQRIRSVLEQTLTAQHPGVATDALSTYDLVKNFDTLLMS